MAGSVADAEQEQQDDQTERQTEQPQQDEDHDVFAISSVRVCTSATA
jgi:hypothetical protein